MVKVEEHNFPDELYYWTDHTWVKIEGDKVRVGMDDFGQKLAGKILFVRLPPTGKEVSQGKTLGMLETGKWVGPIRSPVSGTIVEVNPEIRSKPKLVNEDPYGAGWLAVIKPTNLEADLANLTHGADKVTEWMKKEIVKWAEKIS